MASGTVPIQTCDDESWCDAWELDLEATGAVIVSGRNPLDGWVIDRRADQALCPEHAPSDPTEES
ncbi:hypothetical protein ACFP63_08775 [Oerskovia jenensis]|uniref:Uncharacterized protein n=1 Tax=Oerskovia jenensis TaxID=162169 RepID=A0ABS2LI92_9CELL|nr:hypothetical protein [Oerskovia jenensis]MBM7480146.1 hypothetical protein [Oerskovia jenensis]